MPKPQRVPKAARSSYPRGVKAGLPYPAPPGSVVDIPADVHFGDVQINTGRGYTFAVGNHATRLARGAQHPATPPPGGPVVTPQEFKTTGAGAAPVGDAKQKKVTKREPYYPRIANFGDCCAFAMISNWTLPSNITMQEQIASKNEGRVGDYTTQPFPAGFTPQNKILVATLTRAQTKQHAAAIKEMGFVRMTPFIHNVNSGNWVAMFFLIPDRHIWNADPDDALSDTWLKLFGRERRGGLAEPNWTTQGPKPAIAPHWNGLQADGSDYHVMDPNRGDGA